MIVFPPPSLHKYFHFKNRAEHLFNTDSEAQQRPEFDDHRKGITEYISVESADPPFESARKIHSRARGSLPRKGY